MRLDLLLVEKGLAESRKKAHDLIVGGLVTVSGKKVTKPSAETSDGDDVAVLGELYAYVGRGGVKLEAALDGFAIDVGGKNALDVGASTGGFTDCLLQRGASHVCALDSGNGQLHPRLLADERVTNLENYNARDLNPADFNGPFDIVTADVSFISQTYILSGIASVLAPEGKYIGLVKPQFEVGRESIGKHGIVRDPALRRYAIERVLSDAERYGLFCTGLMRSPIEGGDGNVEFLICLERKPGTVSREEIRRIAAGKEIGGSK